MVLIREKKKENGEWTLVGGVQKEIEGGCREKCNNWSVLATRGFMNKQGVRTGSHACENMVSLAALSPSGRQRWVGVP